MSGNPDKQSGTMLYLLASSNLKDESRVSFLVDYISNKKFGSTAQLNGIKKTTSNTINNFIPLWV